MAYSGNMLNVYRLLTFVIAAVWFGNGLFCKVLNWIPRHQQIVAEVLSETHAYSLIIAIGLAEIAMAVWVLSGVQSRWNCIVQIMVVVTMNVIEFLLVPELLLWGRFNSVFALIFIGLVYYWEFVLRKKTCS